MSRNRYYDRYRYRGGMEELTFDYICKLISVTYDITGEDIRIPIENSKEVLCAKKDVYGANFYQAKQSGINLDFVLIVNKYEYGGEALLDFEGRRYQIIRHFEIEENVELTCAEVRNGQNS